MPMDTDKRMMVMTVGYAAVALLTFLIRIIVAAFDKNTSTEDADFIIADSMVMAVAWPVIALFYMFKAVVYAPRWLFVKVSDPTLKGWA